MLYNLSDEERELERWKVKESMTLYPGYLWYYQVPQTTCLEGDTNTLSRDYYACIMEY